MRLVDEADLLVDRLIGLTQSGENADAVKLRAILAAAKMIGLEDDKGMAVSARQPQSVPLSNAERDKLASFLLDALSGEDARSRSVAA